MEFIAAGCYATEGRTALRLIFTKKVNLKIELMKNHRLFLFIIDKISTRIKANIYIRRKEVYGGRHQYV